MPEEGFKRKLAAILSADAVGYSRLMRDDEEATVRELTAHRVLISVIIDQYGGRVIDSPGDNILAEFASVVDAVKSAIKIQEKIKFRNAVISDNRRMEFRVGVNLGDVIDEGGRIYGDGVNIAARVEGLSEAGGISISGTVYEHIKNKLSLHYHFLGKQNVKNIAEPIQVYRIIMGSETAGKINDEKLSKLRRRYWVAVLLAVMVLGVVVTAGWIYTRSGSLHEEKATGANGFLHTLERASIAVLPFSNLSGDPEQEYFSDGITNDLITDLSKFQDLLVIASNTIFTYKAKPVNVENVGKELGVRYVLEGSVQKAGAKVRVNAQLINTATGYHLWSERYERELKDIFAVQNEIVQTIVGKLAVKIDAEERKRVMHKKTESLEAYDLFLRGIEHLRHLTRSDNRKAREMFEKAIELDPDFASAYVGLGRTYLNQVSYGWTEFPTQALQQAKELAGRALGMEDSNADAYALLGFVYIYLEQYDLAVNQLNRAIELNPNDASALRNRGQVMLWSGKVDDAIHSLENTFRFDPNQSPGGFMSLGLGYYLKGQYNKAIKVLEEGLSLKPDWVGNHIALAATYAQSDRAADATREAQEVLRLDPFFKVDSYGTAFRNPIDRAKIVEGLRKAGLK